MSDIDRILRLAGLATTSVAKETVEREMKEQAGCPCCGGRCTCKGDCPDCNCHGNNDEWNESADDTNSECGCGADETVTEAESDTYAVVTYNYSEDWASIDLYKDGEQVERWNDYFHSNETGNPLTAKIAELAQAHGIDPEGLKLVDGEDQQTGVFTNGTIKWDASEGNAYTGALAKAKAEGDDEFEVGGKTHKVKEGEDDRDELTKKLFPRKSREEMEKADQERNRAMNQKRFMKPGKPSRSREWGAYESVDTDEDDRDELTKKLFPRKSREEMEKADRERNRAMNQKRFMKPGKPSRSREWGAYESVDTDEEVLDEAVAKIACLECDEVSTAKAWEKNNGFCPKCKTSNKGVAESIEEAAAVCESCHESPCTCDCDDELTESPTMDTTQLITLMRLSGINEETIKQKLDEWANTPEGVGEVEPTAHGDAYDFAQSVNLSLKRYLDAEDMKVQVKEHTVENMKALYEAKKNKK